MGFLMVMLIFIRQPIPRNTYSIKVGNYVPNLTYLLGPYKLPVLFEDEQYRILHILLFFSEQILIAYLSVDFIFFLLYRDESVICLIPEHPNNLIQEFLVQLPFLKSLKGTYLFFCNLFLIKLRDSH